MKIIDAHHHFWDLDANYLPWLKDKPVKFRYGDYQALKRNYLPKDYRADVAPFELGGSVFIETEWDPMDPLGEVAWVAGVRAASGLPSVMVAQAWLDREDAEEVLAAHGATDFVRGIRHKPAAAPSPDKFDPGAPGSMADPAWRRGYAMLASNGLTFDLQTPWWHLVEARDLAEAFPDTRIHLNHTGLPADRSPEGLAGWRKAMKLFAAAPNVAVKISGIGVPGHRWSVEDNRAVVLDTIDIFGPDRCMFASNFPVDSLVGSFQTIFSGFLEITSEFSEADRRKMFHDNAANYYRMTADEPV
ncbi:amidohydrolase family protein [Rhodobacteraceae bacterium 2CG4]|uniref:Amidohydrolase family protein n=1 Tax=Halovulum marinum TaxID=2662447 RepID=A0A6L5YZ61_9RHOB|nr:amidohydrolase family protein [Halovulum marinum]MSU89339.1 amidohydrolase family protein [Halovulum marinum]